MSLGEARDIAGDKRALLRQGIDPIEAKKEAQQALIQEQAQEITFDQAVEIALPKRLAELKNPKHRLDWQNSLKNYASPVIGNKLVVDISVQDILSILQPIWETKTDTAKKLQNRISYVMGWAIKTKKMNIENPADWGESLKDYLPNPKKLLKRSRKNYPALPYERSAEFMGDIQQKDTMSAKALQFLILTAARAGEVRGAVWNEINLKKRKWVIPAERMKIAEDHTVFLSDQAVKLLEC